MSAVRVAARDKRREFLGTAIDTGERPKKKPDLTDEQAFPVFMLGRNLWFNVEPMTPDAFRDVECLASFVEAEGYQKYWRLGVEDAEEEARANNR